MRKSYLYNADAADLLAHLADNSVDMIFADPPYFLSNGGITCANGKMVAVNKGRWDKSQGLAIDHAFNVQWLDHCKRILKPHGTIWITGTYHNIHSVGFALQSLDYKILNDIAWYKINPPPNLSCRYFTHATETILWAAKTSKSKHTFHYALMKAENGGKQMQSLWHILPPGKAEKKHGKHPAQKPLALLRRIIEASTNPNEVILDPFCGSATTGVACARLNRRFIGIDKDEKYLELAKKRLEEETISTSIFVFTHLSGGEEKSPGQDPLNYLTWEHIISNALSRLGGEGNLKEINDVVRESPRTHTSKTWPSTVRRVVRQSRKITMTGKGRYKLNQIFEK